MVDPEDIAFPKARVFCRQRGTASSCSTDSYIAISSDIRWKPVVPRDPPPTSPLAFKNENFHELKRLPYDAEWDDVERAVGVSDIGDRHVIVIPLNKRFRGVRKPVPMELVIEAERVEQRDAFLHAIRLLIAPWQLLEKRLFEVKQSLPSDITLSSLTENIFGVSVEVSKGTNEDRGNPREEQYDPRMQSLLWHVMRVF